MIGSLCGAVILFESALKRTIVQDKFELTFVAPSQVLVKEISDTNGGNILVESQLGLEIYDVRIMGKLHVPKRIYLHRLCLTIGTTENIFLFQAKTAIWWLVQTNP